MDLPSYLQQLEVQEQLRRVPEPVAPDLELAGHCRREFAAVSGGQALLFETLAGKERFRAVGNLFGSPTRLETVLRCVDLEQFGGRLRGLFEGLTGSGRQRLAHLSRRHSTTIQPVTDELLESPCNLLQLPAIRSWSGERKPYLTLGITVSADPDSGRSNLGLYRVQVLDEKHLAINIRPTSGAGAHLTRVARAGGKLPVTLFFGGDPAWIWLASAPLADSVDERGLFQTLFAEHPGQARSELTGLEIPADVEVIIEGNINPRETVCEGPFGNHTGQYVTRKDCPVLQVQSIRTRTSPIIPLTVVGPPPSENVLLARGHQQLVREILRVDCPEIADLWMPESTIYHGAALLSVRDAVLGMSGVLDYLWNESPLSQARLLLLFDEDIRLQNVQKAWWRLINQLHPARIHSRGQQVAIDATGIDHRDLIKVDEHVTG